MGLIACGVRVARATKKFYHYGYCENKRKFAFIFSNMLLWCLAQLTKDLVQWPYQVCVYFETGKSCHDLSGSIFWSNLGFWLWMFPMKLPYLSFAWFDPASDLLADFNRYPEMTGRVSIFQYNDYHKLRQRLYDDSGD